MRLSTGQYLLNQINALQKLWLLSFTELLEKDNSVSILKKNLGFFAIEMFKFNRGLSPTLVTELIPQMKIVTNCEIMLILLYHK